MSGAAFGCSLRQAAFPLECGHAPVMLVAKAANDFGLTGRSMAIIQPRTHHFGWTSEETIVQLHGVGPWAVTHVDPADDRRKK
jgi:hypothetical protein